MNPVSQVDIKLGAILNTVVMDGWVGQWLQCEEDGICNGQETHQRYRIRQTELIYPEDNLSVSIIKKLSYPDNVRKCDP